MSENNNQIFNLTTEQKQSINTYLDKGRRDVPMFCEEGVNEVIYIPIKDGELRVFYHKPEKSLTKRPIVFLPGYVAAPFTWKDFHVPHHGIGEYFYVDTREKASSKIKRNRKVSLDIEQSARDLPEVIDYLGLSKRDHVLYGASYGGAVIFQSLIQQLIEPPTVVTFDPVTKWVYGNFFSNVMMGIVPLFILSPMRTIFAKISLARMENQAQKDRLVAFLQGAEPWKFKQSFFQNKKFDISNDLSEIKSELFICHGPLDKYHPRIDYYNFAKTIPKGRFIFMETKDEDRELLAGVIATEFAMKTKTDGLPESLKSFEIPIHKD